MRLVLLMPLLLWAAGALAPTEGTVQYDATMNLRRNLPPDMSEEMKARIPEARTTKMELKFNATESLYAPADDPEADAEADAQNSGQGGPGGGFRMMMSQPGDTYLNFTNKTRLAQRDFFGKEYLVSDSLNAPPAWKMTEETKVILGQTCRKATVTMESPMRMGGGPGGQGRPPRPRNVVAWYAEGVPVMAGPGEFHSLPGLVLEVNVNDGEQIILAKKLDLATLKKAIKAPTSGKKMTRAEFEAMIVEKMKEMRANGGFGGGRN
ncbi:MAG: GLPGLI family protein [Bernardetiaceae bacterium]|jgi:GLPGLI family protein|nr:GLPGLI family protein [Bernardetiaceae bacterium]